MRKRTATAWGVAILCFVVLMLVTPAIPQSQEYHNFADQREFLGDFLFARFSTLNFISIVFCFRLLISFLSVVVVVLWEFRRSEIWGFLELTDDVPLPVFIFLSLAYISHLT